MSSSVRFAIYPLGAVWAAELSLRSWTGPALKPHPRLEYDADGEPFIVGHGTQIEDAIADATQALGRVCLDSFALKK